MVRQLHHLGATVQDRERIGGQASADGFRAAQELHPPERLDVYENPRSVSELPENG